MRYRIKKLGLFDRYRVVFVWPWNRNREKCRIDRHIANMVAVAKTEARRLRDLGASDAAIFEQCLSVGRPPNSRWRRFKAWASGDFMLLHLLRTHAGEKVSS